MIPALGYHTELALFNYSNSREFMKTVNFHLHNNIQKLYRNQTPYVMYDSDSCPYVKMNGCFNRLADIREKNDVLEQKRKQAILDTVHIPDIAHIIYRFTGKTYNVYHQQKVMVFCAISDKRREGIMRHKVLKRVVEEFDFLDVFIQATFHEEPDDGHLFTFVRF